MSGSGRTLRARGGADEGPAIGTNGAEVGVGGVGTRGGGRGYWYPPLGEDCVPEYPVPDSIPGGGPSTEPRCLADRGTLRGSRCDCWLIEPEVKRLSPACSVRRL